MDELVQAWINSMGNRFPYVATSEGVDFEVSSGDDFTLSRFAYHILEIEKAIGCQIDITAHTGEDDSGIYLVVSLRKHVEKASKTSKKAPAKEEVE